MSVLGSNRQSLMQHDAEILQKHIAYHRRAFFYQPIYGTGPAVPAHYYVVIFREGPVIPIANSTLQARTIMQINGIEAFDE
ncbi:hypothetical protein NHQ30_011130 [Ciborinia camelliae]|nr:hypothetical protein NHQ30_011130 [Ciborinia camelliae]